MHVVCYLRLLPAHAIAGEAVFVCVLLAGGTEHANGEVCCACSDVHVLHVERVSVKCNCFLHVVGACSTDHVDKNALCIRLCCLQLGERK